MSRWNKPLGLFKGFIIDNPVQDNWNIILETPCDLIEFKFGSCIQAKDMQNI